MAIRSLSALDALQTHLFQSMKDSGRRAGRLRFAMRSVLSSATLGCIALVLSTSGGCSIGTNAGKALMRHDCVDEFMVDYRNRAMAAKAWHCSKQKFCNRGHLNEFQAGFYAGYANIANGGTGCCPAIAPKEYWGWKYQSSDGQAGVNAWFEGFPMGVQAAEVEGIGHWSQIRPAGLQTVVPGSATGMPMPMGVPIELMPGETLHTPYMSEPMPGLMPGGPVMLETGPQVLMNQPAQPATPATGASASNGGSTGNRTLPDAVTIAPVNATSDQVGSSDSQSAVFDTSSGASATIGDTNNDELPFSFK